MTLKSACPIIGCLATITLMAWATPPAWADLLVQQGTSEWSSYRLVTEEGITCLVEDLEAALVLFFPPLSPPPGDPPVDPPDDPPDPPDPPDDPPGPPDDPPGHHPEPASIVAGALGGLICLVGWRRRRVGSDQPI